MSIYQAAAIALVLGTAILFLGIWLGKELERADWEEKIQIMTKNPKATKEHLGLIFRLDQRK